MRILVALPFLLFFIDGFCQDDKTMGLPVVPDKSDVFYAHIDNPLTVNVPYDSLKCSSGELKIIGSKLYLNPSKDGNLFLIVYKNGEKLQYPIMVKALAIKPIVKFRNVGHGKIGKIQDKKEIRLFWDVDYDVKLKVEYFTVEISKANGKTLSMMNVSNRFRQKVVDLFRDLRSGDVLRIINVKGILPDGSSIYAEDLEMRI